MTQSKHTPGPWRVAVGRQGMINVFSNEARSTVASCGNANPENSEISGCNEANANLIAAAPELLEALKKAISGLKLNHCGSIDGMTIIEMEAVVDKARGTSCS